MSITLGDHIYRRAEIYEVLRSETRIVKPANYPAEALGAEIAVVQARNGVSVAVFSLLGRVFMRPVDCPFKAADRVLAALPKDVRVILLDFHAEATSDMQLMGRYLDGRVSAVLGTHTHVPTADECIFPGGTAFQCDVGMTGPYESILGRQIERVMETTLTFMPTAFDVATGDVRLSGTIVDVDPDTGKAQPASGAWSCAMANLCSAGKFSRKGARRKEIDCSYFSRAATQRRGEIKREQRFQSSTLLLRAFA